MTSSELCPLFAVATKKANTVNYGLGLETLSAQVSDWPGFEACPLEALLPSGSYLIPLKLFPHM